MKSREFGGGEAVKFCDNFVFSFFYQQLIEALKGIKDLVAMLCILGSMQTTET